MIQKIFCIHIYNRRISRCTIAVKSVNPDIPVTANLMGIYCCELNYFRLGRELDVVSWDSYPDWHNNYCSDFITARNESLSHDMMRSIKKQPFLLMECTPSTTNWRNISKLKKPNMHELSVVNAVAHGSDAGMYFQMRQSRGSAEKFHSAVISHTGTENTRRQRLSTANLAQASGVTSSLISLLISPT